MLLVGQGVIQNFHGHTEITAVEGTTQVLAGGPAASQIAIKQLGTNGEDSSTSTRPTRSRTRHR